ncbi:MAG: protease pro-enzyme activation domain-containing protein [Terracidiphilus sp.]
MLTLRLRSLCVLAGALLCVTAAMAQNPAPAARIVNPIDESQLKTLKGTMHPLANAKNDRGAVPDSTQLSRMHLVLTRSASQETALRQLIGELHTPGATNYHKWLTPDEFGKQFGPSDEDIATVETWLTGHGFSVTKVNPGKQTIEISGNVAQFRSAFHAQIHQYEVNGQTHYANAGDPQIPAALAPVVGGFVSLNNFQLKHPIKVLGKATYDPKTDKATPEWSWGTSAGVNYVLAPGDYAVQYDIAPLYNATPAINGSGQAIAIVNPSNLNMGVVNSFRSLFGLPYNPPQVIIDGNDPGVNGINNPDGQNGWAVESYLDVEWAGAVAPNATVYLVTAGDTELENGLILAAEHAVYGNVAPIISVSVGECEEYLGSSNQFIYNLWEQAAAQGITVMISSDDNGSAGCDNFDSQYYAVGGQAVSGFTSTPFNVSVGGTDFYYSDWASGGASIANYWNSTPTQLPAVSLKDPITEQPWNDSQYGLNIYNALTESGDTYSTIAAGSGGASNCVTGSGTGTYGGWATCTAGYPKPSWQTAAAGIGVPSDGVRDIPDVSLFAANGDNYSFYPLCAEDGDCQPPSGSNLVQISGVGGTSASSPAFAGIMALVNQQYGRQGQADFVLYPLAQQYPAAFHDVTVGTNSVPCSYSPSTPDCIAVANPVVIDDPYYGSATEGQIGTGTTPEYNARAGYDLASGLGTIDANVLVTDWNKVSFAPTTTTLTPSSTSFTHGTSITVSGTVTSSGTPSGSVALMTSSTEPVEQGQGFPGLFNNNTASTFTLSGGAFSGSVSTLPGGTYNIWGSYSGDGTNGMSTSTPIQITVSPENTNLAFNIYTASGTYTSTSTPGSNVDYGTQFLLSATPSRAAGGTTYTIPTGTVTFTDNTSTVLKTAVINAEGEAEFNAPFSVGAHSVTASYSGDSSYNAKTAAAIPFTVVKDSPLLNVITSFLTNGEAINGTGQPTVLTVQIENGIQSSNSSTTSYVPVQIAAPTGTVTVTGLPSGAPTTGTLSPGVDPGTGAQWGVVNFIIPAGTASGTYNVTVSYGGDGNYNSNSQSYTIPVANTNGDGLLNSTTTASMSGSISPTTTITITGTVTGQSGHPAPTGTVNLYVNGYYESIGLSPGTGDVSNFYLTLSSSGLLQGTNLITFQYNGDSVYNPSAFQLSAVSNPLSDFTLAPQATIVPISMSGGTGSGTDTINLASLNGFSGAVALTCTAAPGVTCSISPSAPSLSSGTSTTATLTINAGEYTPNLSYNVLVTGTDPTGKYVHTLGIEAVVSGSPVGSTSFFLSNSGNITVSPGATTGNTSTITVTPLGAFTGAVDLTCAVVGPSGATSPATCTVPASVTISSSTAQTATLTINTTSTTTAGAYTVTVTGTSGSITPTTVVTVRVGTPSFALANSGNITVMQGATSGNTSTVTVTPSYAFTGTVSLSCAITPTAASAPATCNVPASVTISGLAAQTATLTVYTTASTRAENQMKKLFWPSAGGATLALVLFLGIPRRRRNWLAMLGLLALIISVAGIGCGGGGGGGGGGGNNGTTPGTYTVTVTGTSGTGASAITQTTAVTLTVNAPLP